MGIIILSALVAHTAWHWMLDRFVTLRQFRFEWPALDSTLLAMALRWLMLLLILAGGLWLFRSALRWWNNRTKPEARAPAHPASHPILEPTETSISAERPN
jgi:TRAP-type C4-dicarboxylate transport system permease small subunit